MTVRVLVVDDDFRVAEQHARHAAAVPGFEVVGTARSAGEALDAVERLHPDLVLLDNFLPDETGVSLARRIGCDVILVSADSSAATVRAAVAAGALNVVVKPFTADVLAARLTAYLRYRQALPRSAAELGQAGVDRALQALRAADRPPTPKGQSPVTVRLVADAVADADAPVTATEVADALGIARATAQRYLAGLVEEGRADMSMRYGTTGRPEHLYRWTG